MVVVVGMGVNAMKGGGSLLLRNYGGCVRPPSLLLPTATTRCYCYCYCVGHLVKKGYGSVGKSMAPRPGPLPLCSSSTRRPAPPTKLFFCTRAFQNNVATDSPSPSSSSNPEAPSSPSSDDGNDDDLETKIRNAANTLDIRVGRILRAWRHEEADSLYVEEVDIGEPQPRIICSGLVNYIPLQHLQDKQVVVLANLKPRNMRGVKSSGMLMAASDASHENVALLVPPEGSLPGERIWFGSADEKDNLPAVATPNQIQKKKIWELVQPHLMTDSNCVASLGECFMRTSGGLVVCRSLKNANIS
ncbi:uncharacterized protein LOC127787882 [Diospyros lotus]|uniref:uncharacterized protein LOC127787882 n=1 Tax=Diospyros lotus TaxID=55363 RepID=UPI00225B2D56|nr:uncharacterized protein LOC127787882 [Diospyros lotus]